jgi:uncharacterized protein involved in exopolysaccharide biosynthesis
MPDILYLISKWWKQMLLIIVLSIIIVSGVLFLKPSKYLSVTTALPASSYASDKASIFNNNIQQLYPAMGTPDDLDKIIGTAQLDTVYLAVAKEFNLYDHYKVEEQGEAAIQKAAFLLKANTKVIKSDFSELKVKVWDTDKNLAPQLANAIMNKLQSIHQDIQNSNNVSILDNLQTRKEGLESQIWRLSKARDSALIVNKSVAKQMEELIMTWSEQIQQYEKLSSQYQLIVDSKAPVLIIVEKARASNWPDKPKKLPILVATFALSFLFTLLLALLLEKRKMTRL